MAPQQVRAQVIDRIIKLRDHALSVAATFPDEAKLFREKALELMHQHGISHAEVRVVSRHGITYADVRPSTAEAAAVTTPKGPGRATRQARGVKSPPPLSVELQIGPIKIRAEL